MANLYLFTGENGFQMREEKHRWIDQFVKKHGEENVQKVAADSLTFRYLLDEVAVSPFIAGKRLVCIDGIPKLSADEMTQLPKEIHPDCIVLMNETKPDKRLGGVKTLLKIAEVKEFPVLSGAALRTWVAQYAGKHGKRFASDALETLITMVGEDQETLSQEIQKLCTYVSGETIANADVKNVAVPSGDQEVWHLTNLIARGQVHEAIVYARSLLIRGEDGYSLWSMILWMLRSLVSVYAAVAAGERNPATIASQAGVPFPTVRTLQPIAQGLSSDALRRVVEWAAAADIDLKTGGYRVTADAPQELYALIDRCIIGCGTLSSKTSAVSNF